jgi:hypothetical protein
VGVTRLDLVAGSMVLLAFAWLVLRNPAVPYHPEARFRTLRKLGLIGRGQDKETKDD